MTAPAAKVPADGHAEGVGERMYRWAGDLFPLCRSITGAGVRETLAYLGGLVDGLRVHEVPSGTRAFDWTVPDEWTIRDAYVLDPGGRKVIDFKESNLHVVGYSEPVDREMDLDALQDHLHSLPDRPDAMPYVTSYYQRRWGFCLSQRRRDALQPGRYRAVIDSTLAPGSLTYGELVLPGRETTEVLLSTYVCHPSLANNELSGPVVATALAQWLAALPDRRHTYRIVFVPETIGAIVYLSRNLAHLKEAVVAGFNITCVGDDRSYSYLPSRAGDTLADRTALHVLSHMAPGFARYTWLDRASDERQYCAPGVDLPVATVMRTRYGDYPEYHTSDDDLTVISPAGLEGGFDALRRCLECLELNETLQTSVLCEPQLGRRNLISNLGTASISRERMRLSNLLTFCDGSADLLAVAETLGEPLWELGDAVETLKREGLLGTCPTAEGPVR